MKWLTYILPMLCLLGFFIQGSPGRNRLLNFPLQSTPKPMYNPSEPDPFIIEQTEIAAWRDLLDAAPDTFKFRNGLNHRDIGGGMATHFEKMPIPLFNRVIGLGLSEPLSQDIIDQIKSFYSHHEKYLIHYSSPMVPAGADSLLRKNGFYLAGSWERIIRNNAPLQDLANETDSIVVKRVDSSLKESWVSFLLQTYGFDFYAWPRAFCCRKGWKHYVAFKNDKIVACRSFFMTDKKTVFSGVDAPVPGVMTPDHGPDWAIWKRALQDGIREGATLFVADIELPDHLRNQEAYDGFAKLGFQIPYTRYHYRLNK